MNPKLSSLIDRKPSIRRIIFTDNASFLLTLGAIVAGIFVVTIPFGLLFIYFLIKRVRFIQNVFSKGVPVQGMIVSQRFSNGSLRLQYQYQYQYKDYESINRIVRWKTGLKNGDTVEVFLNPEKPTEAAFLTQIYL